MRLLLKIIQSKWIQHLVFWVLSIFIIGAYFSISNVFKFIDLIYALIFHIPLMVLVYLNLNLIVPKFLETRRFIVYTIVSIANLGLAYAIHEFIFEIALPLVPSIYMVSFVDWLLLIQIFAIYLFITTLFKLSRSWYSLQHVEKENLALELNSLKTQVNPHFFFNSLNSIYSLALKKDDRTPEVVLELSQLMRYMLYEVSDEKVSLQKEIDTMNAYIDLQRLRADESTKIEFMVEGEVGQHQIAPLLFFPLIENSFKHGIKGRSAEAYVSVKILITDGHLSFTIKNNKGEIDDMEEGKYGGIGLVNVEKRLALIYPSGIMKIEESANDFEVKVNIEL